MFGKAYLGHDWFALFVLDVAERHLRALVLVDLEIRVVNVWDLVNRDCASSASHTNTFHGLDLLLSWTQILVTRTAVSVVICTGPRRRPSYPFLRSSEVRSR